jgi:acyl dehydratase
MARIRAHSIRPARLVTRQTAKFERKRAVIRQTTAAFVGSAAMSTNAANAHAIFLASLGKEEGVGEWFEVTQERINQFADVTNDHQFIHVDPEAAKTTPFGTTIAHGFLTLSLLTWLDASITKDPARYSGMVMGVNYGFEKVRFVSPVKVGKRVRCRSVLAAAELKDPWVQTTRTMTVEIEGESKPALVADWITRIMYG